MELTLEALFGAIPLAPSPSRIKLSPDGRHASYLLLAPDVHEPSAGVREGEPLAKQEQREGESLAKQELYVMDLRRGTVRRVAPPRDASGGDDQAATPGPTEAEQAERERRRSFSGGITSYQWHPDSARLLLVEDGCGYLVGVPSLPSPKTDASQFATPPGQRQTDIRLSPQGTFASYVRAGDLYVRRLDDGTEQRVTADGGGTVSNGIADFIAQEEMHRFDGHWWSQDERRIAFTRVDAEPIPETHRHEVRAGRIDVVAQRYPFAGGPNAEVRLKVHDLESGQTQEPSAGEREGEPLARQEPSAGEREGEPLAKQDLDWAQAADDYLARVDFAPDGALFVQVQSRDQTRLALRRWADGAWREVLAERGDTWVNLLNDGLTFVGDAVLWLSERSGSSQLYRIASDGAVEALAPGRLGRVNAVLGADKSRVWVTGWRDDPTTQDLFEIAFETGACRALTAGNAWHDGVVNPKAGIALVARSSPSEPAAVRVVRLNAGRRGRLVAGGPVNGSHPYFPFLGAHTAPELGRIPTGGETLHFRLTKPARFDPDTRHPVLVQVYGGPGVQRVRRDFPPLVHQLLAQRGYAVFELDNRGGSNRSKAFEDAIHGELGRVEVDDQLRGVDYLRGLPWVDPRRIGIFGHSYGGYMVLKCLARTAGTGTFAAGASIAPVARWQLYDTHYTERYLGTPDSNRAGFEASSVFPEATGIDAPLLLIHGMADDNVLFAHSTELMAALQSAGVRFELMTYPGAKHALQAPSVAIHRHDALLAFFARHLSP